MTLNDLIARLQDIADLCDGQDPDVRLALQPAWPMEHHIAAVILIKGKDSRSDDDPRGPEDGAEDADTDQLPDRTVVYIAECGSAGNGYLPDSAVRRLGWR